MILQASHLHKPTGVLGYAVKDFPMKPTTSVLKHLLIPFHLKIKPSVESL